MTITSLQEAAKPRAGVNPALQLAGVRHSYGRVEVLHGIDFAMARGELVAMVGPSGSGKTTLLAVAGGLLRPTLGEVLIQGENLYGGAKPPVRLTRKVAFVLQGSSAIPFLTVEENLLVRSIVQGKTITRADRPRAAEILASIGLAEKAGSYPSALSGGERQRVCVASALYAAAPLVLADEPTASLDRARGRDVVQLLASHAHETEATVLVSTHDERSLDLVDRVVEIEDGQIHASLR